MTKKPRIDLRPGITEPVVLLIARHQVETADIESVLSTLKPFLASREEIWRYRGQMVLVVDGYDNDPRELVEIPEVRSLLQSLDQRWPHWAFFFNQVDDSIKLLASCVCGNSYLGEGTTKIDPAKLLALVERAFASMNALFDAHGFPEKELESMSLGFTEALELDNRE